MTVNRIAALATSVAVIVTIVAGLFLAGSPSEQRMARFDKERLSDLRYISNSVERYWRERHRLPEDLSELADGIIVTRIPMDPESGASYSYEITAKDAYRVCAVFDGRSADPEADGFWAHERGRHCFQFDYSGRD